MFDHETRHFCCFFAGSEGGESPEPPCEAPVPLSDPAPAPPAPSIAMGKRLTTTTAGQSAASNIERDAHNARHFFGPKNANVFLSDSINQLASIKKLGVFFLISKQEKKYLSSQTVMPTQKHA